MNKTPFTILTFFLAVAGLSLLFLTAGCSSFTDIPPGSVQQVESALLEKEDVFLPVFFDTTPPPRSYQVGPGDVLAIHLYGQEDLTSPSLRMSSSGRLTGSRVDGDGSIHLPLLGTVEVAGLTLVEVEERLSVAFSAVLADPAVTVEVAEFRSQPLNLLGQFRSPGVKYMERPLTLLEGIALGDGLTDLANLRSARLIRGQETLPVDLYELLLNGMTAHNIWLRPGDTIFIPDDRNQTVFVFGAVDRPGPVVMPNGNLTLGQALASAGVQEARGKTSHVRIIRSLSATRGQLLVVDLEEIWRGRALPFPLQEGDLVYLPRGILGNWNEAISEILPTLQAASAILTPFVQIRYLEESND